MTINCTICGSVMNKIDEYQIVDPHEDITYGTCEVYQCPVDGTRWIGNAKIKEEWKSTVQEIEAKIKQRDSKA